MNKLYGIKQYKPSEYFYSKEDDIFYQFYHWLKTGERKPVRHLILFAQMNKKIKLAHQKAWRKANPKPRKRKPLHTNWMGEFRRMVNMELGEQNYMGEVCSL